MRAMTEALLHPPPNPRSRVVCWVLVMGIVLGLIGCRRNGQTPELLSARFADQVHADGAPQEGEQIVFTFSAKVVLEEPASQGVTISENGGLGEYRVEHGAVHDLGPNQIVLTLGMGAGVHDFQRHGIHGVDPGASGISLDLGKLGLRGVKGRALTGVSQTIDIAETRHEPARLQDAEWIDVDRSFTVSEGDRLTLSFDRDVDLGEIAKQRSGEIPPGMFLLPVAGDRFDSGRKGDQSARLQEGTKPNEVIIILGTAPILTPEGSHEPKSSAFVAGAASGIAVNGTTIRPHRGIIDRFGTGVMSPRPIDIGGECTPFSVVDGVEFEPGKTLFGYTATPLTDGRVLVAGGVLTDSNLSATEPPTNKAWMIYPPTAGGEIRCELLDRPMAEARFGHTATYLPGPDLEYDTEDDLILFIGGDNGQKPVDISVEYFRPFGRKEEFLPIHMEDERSTRVLTRYDHTAHLIPETNDVLLVGGQRDKNELNGAVERLTVEFDGELVKVLPEVAAILNWPRRQHASCIVEQEGNAIALLVHGGWGTPRRENGNGPVVDAAVLSNPEVLLLRDLADERNPDERFVIPRIHGRDPGARGGHAIVQIESEEWDLILVGGTTSEFFIRKPGFQLGGVDGARTAFRLELQLTDGVPELRSKPVAALTTGSYDFATILLETGQLLVLGGYDDVNEPIARVELFDPESDRFEGFCSGMNVPRATHATATLLDDQWIIIGGIGSTGLHFEVFEWIE